MDQQQFAEIDRIFNPRCTAIVGASADERKAGSLFLKAWRTTGYRGNLYPVNSSESEIQGLKAYPSLKAIPGEVDLVVVCIPARSVLSLLEDCAAKKVKTVQFFTAGFRELNDSGLKREEEMVKIARRGGFHILGPNCAGIYRPSLGIPCGALSLVDKEEGEIGFISQSGSLALRFIIEGIARGFRFSKMVSYGNACDLDSVDFLEYFALDPQTKVISAYIEGVREGHRFFEALRRAAKAKPVAIWKSGRTAVGAEAAHSHTGSFTSSKVAWEAALKQSGAMRVESMEELSDLLLAFQEIPPLKSWRATVISGVSSGGGGETVAAADTCDNLGLEVPPFTVQTQRRLEAVIGQVGSILRNPLDVSQAYANPQTVYKTIEIVAADPQVDIMIIKEEMDLFYAFMSEEGAMELNDLLVGLREKSGKPIVMVSSLGIAEEGRLRLEKRLHQAHIPIYPTLERAVKALVHRSRYAQFLSQVS